VIDRWECPVCEKPIGKQGPKLAAHGTPRCSGTGLPLTSLAAVAEEVPPPWIPPPMPIDPTPFRRWRALGWTPEQIAAVTGEGALW
jgi:hypothetical protein